ncbi:MAG: amino-acid N-acetyltransferase [Betaproteobacteria bacterium RIFCSPHIGHO2_12_FULL_69_13]|nr:MAG: amino-acid N-acetyltransferase [Betaproteobacteria bacterium RIFCSPHIGHO2_12_FULL_69_13]OGA69326.1 MAG: amino-acid N-acetyltransferase [Betaproteobacteria bacterium RIFCSPLOWO2_12_FULL_68_20]
MATPLQPEAFVRWFRQVAPYVHAFRGRSFVVAFGGEMFAERARFAAFVHEVNLLAALGIRLVLVHGARPQIEAELKAKRLRSRYAQGLRVTDAQALVAVKHAAGVLRVEIEALLSQGLPDSPMAGARIRVASGNFITARPIGVVRGTDFQFTGAVRKVDAEAIVRRLDAGEVVLVPHLGYSPTGEVFNLAWEDVAESVAVALKADKLLVFTDRLPAGRRDDVLAELTGREAESLLKKGGLTPQTARAIEHAIRAVGAGVGRAHLVARRAAGAMLLELFTHSGVGTMITADPVEKLRAARIEEVRGILALIEPLEAEGSLVKRSRELLEAEIGNFLVVEHDGAIVGCAALYPFPEQKSAEFACLAVAQEVRDAGYGERLLRACEERARSLGIRRVFALTTSAAHWFLEQGFRAADVSALPPRRQALYNWRRGSKVFLKRL